MPEEPRFYYQLHEVLYQAYNNNFHVPVLTLDVLRRRAKGSFLYTPELELRRDKASEKPDCEIDICCVLDGELVIGECKRSNKDITVTEIEKYDKLATETRADVIVFSTLDGEWGVGTRENVNRIVKSARIEMLTGRELLSAYP